MVLVSNPNVPTGRNALRLCFGLGGTRLLRVRPGAGLEASL